MIKTRVEVSVMETRETIDRLNEAGPLFFGRMDRIEKALARITKRRRE